MPKKLNEWLDEFVENGADPSDVTAWPEDAGGSSNDIMPITESVSFTINPVELAKIAEQFDGNQTYTVIDEYYIDGSGNSGVSSVVYMSMSNNKMFLFIKNIKVFEIVDSEFSTWSEAILDHATDFSSVSYTPTTNDGCVLTGVVKERNLRGIIDVVDISKILIEQEQSQEL